MKTVAIFGAYSGIAAECARRLAPSGASFFLVGRDPARLDVLAQDLRARGASSVATRPADLADVGGHAALAAQALAALGGLDVALIAHGRLPDQAACDRDPALAAAAFSNDATSAVSLMTALAVVMEPRREGRLVVISSVAGDRGRRSNYVYGAAKAAVSACAEGLRARLAPSGVSVTLVKPGWVDTPMTARLPKNFLFASPRRVAAGILRASERRRGVVYLPWFWRPIMAVIRALPESAMRRIPG